MTVLLLALPAWASEGEVARGWYLWRTGQDAAAAEHAAALVLDQPDALGAHRLHIAMEVARGNGASVEAAYREAWGVASADPVRRVALAFAVTQRHGSAGAWCDEVSSLLAPVTEGEDHYWATVAERMWEQRCDGTTTHADAELRRIADAGGLGWADGVLAEVDAGYLKTHLPDDLERLWAEAPHRLDRADALWDPKVAGPAKGRSRSITSKALSNAVAGDDPMLVHAAWLTYTAIDKAGKADEARERLAQLDPDAQADLERSEDELVDPLVYAEIDACTEGPDVLACLDSIAVPETGSIAAYHLAQQRVAHQLGGDLAAAFEAGLAAWQADPDHRFNARMYARSIVDQEGFAQEDLDLAVEAMEVVLADRVPADPASIDDDRLKRWLARELQLRSAVYLTADRAAEAIDGQLLAVQLQDTPQQRMTLGRLLAAADRADDAVLQIAGAVSDEVDDTSLISEGRLLLADLDDGWHPRKMPGMLDEMTREPGEAAPRHPLVGKPLPDLEAWALPEVDADATGNEGDTDDEAALPLARVLLTWGDVSISSGSALQRLAGLAETYGDRSVAFLAVDVGVSPSVVPEDLDVASVYAGGSAMRALRAVAVPTAVVVDADGRIAALQVPYAWTASGIEDALDDLLPEVEEE